MPSLILACCLRAHVKPLMFQYRSIKSNLTQLSLFSLSLSLPLISLDADGISIDV